MSKCAFCQKEIEPATPAVSVVGGHFPKEDIDFFMIDTTVLAESYAHVDCLKEALSPKRDGESEG
jgi:hypothetical protein